jgi:hypothetical protein
MSGDFEMVNLNSGQRLTIQMDGTELRDQLSPPSIEWCDRGEHFVAKDSGNYTGEGASQLWICLECKKR